jgi:large subunit ribosomal protein L15
LNIFDDGAAVCPTCLKQKGLISQEKDGVKILGNGKLEKKLTVTAHKFSTSAKKAIEDAGGKCEVL